MKTKQMVPYFTTTVAVDADVEIDPDDLHAEGWHHQSECGNEADRYVALPVLANDEVRSLCAALASLHRQAHPSQPASVRLCREEPCRSLTIDQLREVDGG